MANKKNNVTGEVSTEEKVKKPVNKSFIIKLVSVIVACVFFLACVSVVINSYAPANPKDYHVWCLSGISGSFNKSGNPKNYWGVDKTKSGNQDVTVYGNASLITSYSKVKEIWLNVSDLYETEAKIEIVNQSSRVLNVYTLTAEELKADKDGWIKIYDLTAANENPSDDYKTITASKFSFGISTKLNVRELVFVNEDGKLAEYEVTGIKIENREFKVDDAEVKDAKNPVTNLCDEQKTFANKKD